MSHATIVADVIESTNESRNQNSDAMRCRVTVGLLKSPTCIEHVPGLGNCGRILAVDEALDDGICDFTEPAAVEFSGLPSSLTIVANEFVKLRDQLFAKRNGYSV